MNTLLVGTAFLITTMSVILLVARYIRLRRQRNWLESMRFLLQLSARPKGMLGRRVGARKRQTSFRALELRPHDVAA